MMSSIFNMDLVSLYHHPKWHCCTFLDAAPQDVALLLQRNGKTHHDPQLPNGIKIECAHQRPTVCLQLLEPLTLHRGLNAFSCQHFEQGCSRRSSGPFARSKTITPASDGQQASPTERRTQPHCLLERLCLGQLHQRQHPRQNHRVPEETAQLPPLRQSLAHLST